VPAQISNVMRRAFSLLKMGRPGPVMVEIPADVAGAELDGAAPEYRNARASRPAGNPQEVEAAAKVLVEARSPVILAGQGVLYAEATAELVQLAELIQAPVITTLEGKRAFPEDHPLALGTGSGVMTGPVLDFLRGADVVLAVGASLSRHGMAINLPPGKTIIHATNDERDLNKIYRDEHPILGDARLVLGQFVEAAADLLGDRRKGDQSVAAEVGRARDKWLKEWAPKLTSDEVPLNPYRVMSEFMRTVNPAEAIVTHDSGSPRDQLVPFYKATTP